MNKEVLDDIGRVISGAADTVSRKTGEIVELTRLKNQIYNLEREIKRGRRYDGVIMDPPSYGRGPSGEVWKLEENLWPFVELVAQLLSEKPLFFLINSYTTGLAPSVLTYILETLVTKKYGGHTESQELGLPVTNTGLALPCGATGRWSR